MAWDWGKIFDAAGEVLNVVGEAALAKNAGDIIGAWLEIPIEDMEERITQHVFQLSADQLQRINSAFRTLIRSNAFNHENLDLLLTAYAGFHGGWTLRLYLASRMR